jgi:hypothetical protein
MRAHALIRRIELKLLHPMIDGEVITVGLDVRERGDRICPIFDVSATVPLRCDRQRSAHRRPGPRLFRGPPNYLDKVRKASFATLIPVDSPRTTLAIPSPQICDVRVVPISAPSLSDAPRLRRRRWCHVAGHLVRRLGTWVERRLTMRPERRTPGTAQKLSANQQGRYSAEFQARGGFEARRAAVLL